MTELNSHEERMKRLQYIFDKIDESFSNPNKSNDTTAGEFELIKRFFKGVDSALKDKWIEKAIDVYKLKRESPFNIVIQELRSLKGLAKLDEEDLADMLYIYNVVETIQKNGSNETLNVDNIKSFNQVSIREFIIRIRGPHDRDEEKWKRAFNKVISEVIENTTELASGEEEFKSLYEAVKPKAYQQGWDMPKDYLELINTVKNKHAEQQSDEPIEDWDQFANLLKQKCNEIYKVERRDFKKFNDEIEKQEYPELRYSSGKESETASLSAAAAAIVIRAINKSQKNPISISEDGVMEGVEKFKIAYYGSKKNLYNYTQEGGDKDPHRDLPLIAAEKWLNQKGYFQAELVVKQWLSEDRD